MKTQVFKNSFGKHELFSVYEVKDGGEKVGGEDAKPIVSFGIKKAKAILDNLEELKEFVKENG